jgi:hypothetical protein
MGISRQQLQMSIFVRGQPFLNIQTAAKGEQYK